MTEQGEAIGAEATETMVRGLGSSNLNTTRLQQEPTSGYWESIVDSIGDGFWVFDRSWCCTYINSRQAALVGMPKEEVVGKNVWELFPNLIGTEVYRQLHQAVAEQTPIYFEHFSSTWQGWFELRVYPSANGVSILIIDISDAYRQASQRKQTEEVLQDRQYFLQQLAEMSPGLLYLYDVVEQRNIYINKRSLELLGYPPETVLAMGANFITEVMHPDDLAQIAAHFERLNMAQEGSFLELEYRMRHVKGEWRWFSSRSTVFSRTAQGQVRQILGTAQDITERKRAEEALRESEERFQAFMNHSPASAWIADEQGRLLYLSPTYFRMFQFPVQDAVGKNIFDIYPTEFAQQFIDNNKRVFETKQVIETIESAPRPDGNVGEFLVYKFPIPSGEEILLGGVAVDITERRRVQEALRDSEQQLKIALQTAKLGSWQHDLVTGTLTCSEQCKANVGLPSDAEFSHETLFAVLHPEDHALVEAAIQRTLEEHIDYEVEERCFWPDGSLHWLIARGGLVYDSDGTPIRLVGVTLDITERKQIEESLKVAHQQISNILASITDAFVTLDSQWRYSYVNQEAARLLQRSPEELLGKRWQDLFPEAAQSNTFFAQELERSVAEQVTVKFEAFCLATNCWLEVSAFPFPDGLSIYFRDISDRKLAEEALRLSQERYRSLVESLPQLVCMASADGITEYCNQSWMNYTGLTLEQTQGSGWQQALHPDDLPLALEQWTQALETGNAYSIEFRLRRVDGVYRWHLSRIVPIQAEEDRILGCLGTTTDIDDQKHIEQQERFLAQASQTFAAARLDLQTLLDTITRLVSEFTDDVCVLSLLSEDEQWLDPVSCYHVDPEVKDFVTKLLSSYPRRADEGIGGRVMQTGEPLLMPVTSQEELRAALKPEYQYYLERFRVYSTLLVPLKVRGQPIGVLSLTRNYPGKLHNTDDQSLFQDLADRAAMAIANARLYQQAQQAHQQAVRIADRTARLQAVTAALSESLTPAQVAEVIVEQSIAVLNASSAIVAIVSENGTELEIVHSVGYQQGLPEQWRRFPITTPVPLAEAIRTGEPIWEESTQERIARYPHLAQNYAELNYAAWISLPLMVEGRAVGGISINFTQFSPLSKDDRAFMLALAQQSAQAIARARLYEAEQRARASAEMANRIKDEFLAVLSHELRSPLNPILGWTKLLRTRKFDEQATNRALETIERNALLQTQLIEDLLDVSRILRGKMVLNVSPVNLATTVEAALETVRLAAQSKNIQIQTIFAPNVGFVSGDSARLQQVIWNLLSNAVKFTPSGGRVEVRVEQDASYAQIVVSDTGKGINPEFVPYVFDYFRQEDGKITRKFGGLGLGLAIVRHLVELHGGTVEAESSGEGQGATFTVKLPSTEIVKEPDFDSESPVTTFNLSQLRILVVDDEADMRELAVAILSEYGAQVRVAASAAEAFTALDHFKPDVLISDIGMPEVDGYMLMRQVRQLPPQQGGLIPAIALTAYAGEFNQQQALEAGFQRHVAKPVEPYELVKTIATLVGRSR